MFNQRAVGTFTAPVVAGTPHCGIDDKSLCNCSYRIEMQYDDSALDKDGFLLDNTAFRSYFNDLNARPVTVSCENLCKLICLDMCELCGHRAHRVTVALSPFDGVEVEYAHVVSAPKLERAPVSFVGDFAEVS